jgi:leucyl-tRNA synthetase
MVTHETYKGHNGQWLFPEEYEALVDKSTAKVGSPIKMSKSKKNVVDPEKIIETYGADAARLFILSDSPPERDLEWTESGIEGAWRYVNKLHRMVTESLPSLPSTSIPLPEGRGKQGEAEQGEGDIKDTLALRRAAHKTIIAVAADIEAFAMNKAVARIRELSNAIEKFSKTRHPRDLAQQDRGDPAKSSAKSTAPMDPVCASSAPQNANGMTVIECWALRESLEILIKLFNPMMPHLAEELWSALGHKTMLVHEPWPVADETLLTEDSVTIGVQINGKLRGSITLAPTAPEEEAKQRALEQDNVKKALEGLTLRKFIYVPGKIVNMVAG